MALQTRPPELEELVLKEVKLTGNLLGAGAYGSVLELEIPGAVVAAKKLHTQLVNLGSQEQVKKWTTDFVEECKLTSKLRHPNIVQFLGICYLPGSPIPVLVMEKLHTNLDSLLETTPDIPLYIKLNLLKGTCQGMVYLHSHNPPIAHRDLTARNILINSDLTPKIADLGVARMVNIQPGQSAATMTRMPGTGLYMPPEVNQEGKVKYGVKIDIFSFGVVSLFTVTQTFPKDIKPSTYFDSAKGKIEGRSEIERREDYIQTMKKVLGDTHTLVRLTLDCLEYLPVTRPTAEEVLNRLQEVIPKTLVKTRLEIICEKEKEMKKIREDCDEQISLKNEENALLINQIKHLRNENEGLEARIRDLRDILKPEDPKAAAKPERPKSQELLAAPTPDEGSTIVFNWKKCRDIPTGVHLYGQPVSLRGKLYVCAKQSFAKDIVLEYTPSRDEWSQLPALTVYNFSIVAFNGELLVLGGKKQINGKTTNVILSYSEGKHEWTECSFTLPQPLSRSTALEYSQKLLVVGGDGLSDVASTNVSIFNPKTEKWRPLQSLPGAAHYTQALVDDAHALYLVTDRNAKFVKYVHLPSLLTGTLNAWETRPENSLYFSSPIIIGKKLLTVGGSTSNGIPNPTARIDLYDHTTKEWKEVGSLPKPGVNCCCIVFSHKLLVLGLNGATYVAELIN